MKFPMAEISACSMWWTEDVDRNIKKASPVHFTVAMLDGKALLEYSIALQGPSSRFRYLANIPEHHVPTQNYPLVRCGGLKMQMVTLRRNRQHFSTSVYRGMCSTDRGNTPEFSV